MTIDPSAPLTRSPNIIATEVDGEMVLMSIEDGKYYGLDPIGSEIWRRLEEPKSADVLTAELKDHFEGDPDAIARDTREFLDKLADNDLVG
jgi:hypothetical protein